MRNRRAQFFAPAFRAIDVNREDAVKEYEAYVKKKYKIHIDQDIIKDDEIPKRILYRNASCEAIIRLQEREMMEATNPVNMNQKYSKLKSREISPHLDSQRSQFLDFNAEKIVEDYTFKKETLMRKK